MRKVSCVPILLVLACLVALLCSCDSARGFLEEGRTLVATAQRTATKVDETVTVVRDLAVLAKGSLGQADADQDGKISLQELLAHLPGVLLAAFAMWKAKAEAEKVDAKRSVKTKELWGAIANLQRPA